jgi:hypothetical protein
VTECMDRFDVSYSYLFVLCPFSIQNTARSFYAASIFYEILKQFGDCDGEVREWKVLNVNRFVV